jgi:hypothetical protein
MTNKEYKNIDFINIKDPAKEACLIYLDDNGNEVRRDYFGINPRIEYNKNDK